MSDTVECPRTGRELPAHDLMVRTLRRAGGLPVKRDGAFWQCMRTLFGPRDKGRGSGHGEIFT